ncbi:sigma-70 family RNA polymerase sigma factor [Streptomyces sp. NPDC020681]|uniref:sigma-70 family RNA polymerase sigma factor n=1 Tax=Streptomyces sp. NPDC020681 TaxID=3365083 RepID=UPI00379025D2
MEELDRDWAVWESRLHRYAERQLRRHDVPAGRLDADDVVQATWVELHTATKPILWADRYAYTVARHLILRAACQGDRFDLSSPVTDASDESADEYATALEQEWDSPVEREVLRQETAAEIAAAKDRLTSLQRGAVEGTVEQQLPRAEVAARLGVLVGTVSAHRARGLVKLHAELIAVLAVYVLGGVLLVGAIVLTGTKEGFQAAGVIGGGLLTAPAEYVRRRIRQREQRRQRELL